MFESNEKYNLCSINIEDKLNEKIHEFNYLLMSVIDLMPKSNCKKIKEDLKKLLNFEEDELIIEELDSFIYNELNESLYEKVFELLHTVNKCEIILPDKKYFVSSKMTNTLENDIVRKINFDILGFLFIESYSKLNLDNTSLNTIIEKFAHTQKITNEIKIEKIKTIDFVPINLEDLIDDVPNEAFEATYTQETLMKYINLSKCGLKLKETPEYNLFYDKPKECIFLGEFLLSLEYKEFRNKIKLEKQGYYDFEYIKRNLDKTTEKEKINSSKKRKPIKDAFFNYYKKDGNKTPEILANLEKNFYSKNDEYEDEELFERSYLIKKNISDDHMLNQLKHYHFIIPHFERENKKPFFGIYNDDKSRDNNDQSKRGLRSWIDKNGKTCNYNSESNNFDEICEVFSLEPKYSFYYQQHFFEDLLSELFKEMKNDAKIVDMIYSVKLNGKEYDFILLTDDNKIIVVEAKTKLTGLYIEKQLKKFNELHNISLEYKSGSTKTLLDDYIIIGFNSDETCKEKFNFFIANNKIEIANIEEHDKSYNFFVPISGQIEKNLYCISDIYYDNLKVRIEKSLVASA